MDYQLRTVEFSLLERDLKRIGPAKGGRWEVVEESEMKQHLKSKGMGN